jgi:amino acid permease
MVKPPAPIA